MFDQIEQRGLGRKRINYRLRDAIFSRQRYWGEPFPIYYRGDVACPLAEDKLPLELPPIADFGPTEQGEPPLARATNWATPEGYPYELSTMPGFAGSSATTCVTWIRTTTRRSSAVKPTNTGATSTSTWAASSTPRDTSCTRGSGTCSSTTWASSAKRSRSANSSTRA